MKYSLSIFGEETFRGYKDFSSCLVEPSYPLTPFPQV